MRLIFFPALDQVHSAINNRNTGDRRYNWKNVVFSLKAVKSQKDLRKEIADKIDQRIETMRSQGLSTITSLGDLNQTAIRQLYVTLIMLLNTTYPDYDFTSTSSNSFIPISNQQFLTQLTEDVFTPLTQDTLNDITLDLKHTFIAGLKEAIGFDSQHEFGPPPSNITINENDNTNNTSDNSNNNISISSLNTTTSVPTSFPPAITISEGNNNNNNNNDMNDTNTNNNMVNGTVFVTLDLSSPTQNNAEYYDNDNNNDILNQTSGSLDTSMISTTSSMTISTLNPNSSYQLNTSHPSLSQHPSATFSTKDCLIFEVDNDDGDNPLFSSLRLWTKVYLLYNHSLKRVALISTSCKSTQTIYSPALIPLASGGISNAGLTGSNISSSDLLDDFTLSKRIRTSIGGGSRGSRGVPADDDDDDDNDDDGEFAEDYDVNYNAPHRYNNGDDDDNDDSDGYNMTSPPTDGFLGGNNDNSSDSDNDDFYLYNPGIVKTVPTDAFNATTSVIPAAPGSSVGGELRGDGNFQGGLHGFDSLTTGADSIANTTGTYTNHVELVENAQGEIEIIPLVLDPRQVTQLRQQEQQQQQQQQQQNGQGNNHNNTPGLNSTKKPQITMNQTPDFRSTRG